MVRGRNLGDTRAAPHRNDCKKGPTWEAGGVSPSSDPPGNEVVLLVCVRAERACVRSCPRHPEGAGLGQDAWGPFCCPRGVPRRVSRLGAPVSGPWPRWCPGFCPGADGGPPLVPRLVSQQMPRLATRGLTPRATRRLKRRTEKSTRRAAKTVPRGSPQPGFLTHWFPAVPRGFYVLCGSFPAASPQA